MDNFTSGCNLERVLYRARNFMKEIKIGILTGGVSTEHEISLLSGTFIAQTLDKDKYSVKLIPVTKEGDWLVTSNAETVIPSVDMEAKDPSHDFMTRFIQENSVASFYGIDMAKVDCDVIFIGLHGGAGENGKLQGFLDMHNIPYTGSGVLASALAMDKDKTACIYQLAGLKIPQTFAVRPGEEIPLALPQYPLIVKPAGGGSSVGVVKVHNVKELKTEVDNILLSDTAIIQEFISGREVSCGVLEKKTDNGFESVALPITEVIPEAEFFDYQSKYTAGKTKEITPADLPAELRDTIQKQALLAHHEFGCQGYSRTDFIIKNDTPYVLETNTLPGMTGTSLIPQQVAAAGMKIADVFDGLVELALARKQKIN